MMNFLKRCNGSKSPRVKLSNDAFKKFCEVKSQARADFSKLPNGTYDDKYLLGIRWLDDNTVLVRIESAIKDEAEFLSDPYAWALDALRDCARADWHYKFEKEY